MAILSRDVLKTYFKTGAYPTEEQFAALIDSLVHQNDDIPVSAIKGLAALLNNKMDKTDIESLALDEINKWLRVSSKTKNYIVPLTEIVTPNAPTIATTTYYVVTGSVSVAVTNNSSGATMYYSLDGGTTWNVTTGTISLASGFSNDADNSEKTVSVQVKAVMTGEESAVNTYSIAIKPQVAAGSVAVSRTPNDNDYATAAAITLTPSATKGATSEYSEDSGATWAALTAAKTVSVSESVAASKYQVRATKTGYQDATVAKNSAFTLNALKCYYGMSTKAALTASDITALTGGGSLENTILTKNTKYTVALATAGYVWICCTGTMTPSAIFHDASDVINAGFEAAITVGSYKCYRSTEQWLAGSSSIYYKQ